MDPNYRETQLIPHNPYTSHPHPGYIITRDESAVQREKQKIREEILAEEFHRRHQLEAEVRHELAVERQWAQQQTGGGDGALYVSEPPPPSSGFPVVHDRLPPPPAVQRDESAVQREKQKIREEILAEEFHRRRQLEAEVRHELAVERQWAQQQTGGGDGALYVSEPPPPSSGFPVVHDRLPPPPAGALVVHRPERYPVILSEPPPGFVERYPVILSEPPPPSSQFPVVHDKLPPPPAGALVVHRPERYPVILSEPPPGFVERYPVILSEPPPGFVVVHRPEILAYSAPLETLPFQRDHQVVYGGTSRLTSLRTDGEKDCCLRCRKKINKKPRKAAEPKKAAQVWKCSLCKVTVSSKNTLDCHLQGNRHKMAMEKEGKNKGTGTDTGTGTGKQIFIFID